MNENNNSEFMNFLFARKGKFDFIVTNVSVKADEMIAWLKANKEVLKEKAKAYYEANKEQRKAYYEANREKIIAIKKAYNEANKEKKKARDKAYKEANKEKLKAQNKAWREANIGRANATDAKRHASKLQRTPSWLTKEDFAKIKEFYKEAQRLREETGEEYHVDHIIPLQGKNISGLHVPSNLQILRARDNISKGNRYGER